MAELAINDDCGSTLISPIALYRRDVIENKFHLSRNLCGVDSRHLGGKLNLLQESRCSCNWVLG